ncbi:hypothetical protein J2858_002565 [Neorhizobium galegae]|uniref:hypothetical protein n=1 Tax=Neorhizobium galegae TaxID=399 RepID=UPI001AE1DCF6|nr:hypothetical protein [Neorhizobium galegae]MBP2549642.1 hypothetical protein [Neorhizobium galegae]
MTEDKRRRIVEQVIQRLDAHGMAFETDPQFLCAINDWIAGTIEMSQLRKRFLDLLQERHSAVRIRYALPQRPPHLQPAADPLSTAAPPDGFEPHPKGTAEDIEPGSGA